MLQSTSEGGCDYFRWMDGSSNANCYEELLKLKLQVDELGLKFDAMLVKINNIEDCSMNKFANVRKLLMVFGFVLAMLMLKISLVE